MELIKSSSGREYSVRTVDEVSLRVMLTDKDEAERRLHDICAKYFHTDFEYLSDNVSRASRVLSLNYLLTGDEPVELLTCLDEIEETGILGAEE